MSLPNSQRLLDPRAQRDRARAAFEETVNLALTELTEHERICLMAAAGSWARAERAAAIAEFVDLRRKDPQVHIS